MNKPKDYYKFSLVQSSSPQYNTPIPALDHDPLGEQNALSVPALKPKYPDRPPGWNRNTSLLWSPAPPISSITLCTFHHPGDSISHKALCSVAPFHLSIHPTPLYAYPSGSHVWNVTSLAQTPTFLSDDEAQGECVRRRRRRRGEGGREGEREQRRGCPVCTEKQIDSREQLQRKTRVGFHCIAI